MSSKLKPGDGVQVKRLFSQTDFDRFAILSGDNNPIHVDPDFAAGTRFGRTVAHGMFLYSVVCGVLGTRLPGPGTVQLAQDLIFPSATFVGEEVTIDIEVTQTGPAGTAELATRVIRPGGELGLGGKTSVRLPGWTPVLGPAVPTERAGKTQRPSFKGMGIGQQASTRRTFSVQDLKEYIDLTGDSNPIYVDAGYAQGIGLAGQRIPGGLLGGQLSYLLGTELPGRGTNYLKQRLEFPSPAFVGEEIASTVEIVRIRAEKELVNLSTECVNPAGEPVCQGWALVLARDVS